MLFPTLTKKIGVKNNLRGGGGVEKQFFLIYAIFNIKKKKYWKVPLHLLVK